MSAEEVEQCYAAGQARWAQQEAGPLLFFLTVGKEVAHRLGKLDAGAVEEDGAERGDNVDHGAVHAPVHAAGGAHDVDGDLGCGLAGLAQPPGRRGREANWRASVSRRGNGGRRVAAGRK